MAGLVGTIDIGADGFVFGFNIPTWTENSLEGCSGLYACNLLGRAYWEMTGSFNGDLPVTVEFTYKPPQQVVARQSSALKSAIHSDR